MTNNHNNEDNVGSTVRTVIQTDGGASISNVRDVDNVVGRDQTNNYYSGLPPTWPKRDEKEYLSKLQEAFTKELQKRNWISLGKGDSEREEENPEQWDHLYIHPLLSRKEITPNRLNTNHYEATRSFIGTWEALEKEFPSPSKVGLLISDCFEGKSLLLRWILVCLAQEKSEPQEGSNLPVYISVKGYDIRNKDDLLAVAAYSCGQLRDTMQTLWHERKRRITLAIDDGDILDLSQRNRLAVAINELNKSRAGFHSIIVACRQSVNTDMLRNLLWKNLNSDPNFAEWVMLPMDDQRINEMLSKSKATEWLCELIKKDAGLRQLASRAGTLIELIRATRELGAVAPPTNRTTIYAFLVENLIYSYQASERYSYRGIKSKILAFLASRILESSEQTSLLMDDNLLRDVAQKLESLSNAYFRVRRYVPEDWNAGDMIEELSGLPVVSSEALKVGRFEFVNQIYRDYYAAMYLNDLDDRSDEWRKITKSIKEKLDVWSEALVMFSAMPTREKNNDFLSNALSEAPQMAADLWLEKGEVGITRVPQCVYIDYYRRRVSIPDSLDFPVHSTASHLRNIISSGVSPRTALQVTNAMVPLGIDAIDGLLDAAESASSLVAASSIYSLFQMGTSLALGISNPLPLLTISGDDLNFNSNGNCNVTIGDLVFAHVPRTFRAEVHARLRKIDFDPFNVNSEFELWQNPVEWFAINFFRNRLNPDWIGLAVACDAVSRYAGLIAGKARLRGGFQAIDREMTNCAINYRLLCQNIVNDLNFEDIPDLPENIPPQLIEHAKQLYLQLRFFFGRTNRSRMFTRDSRIGKQDINDVSTTYPLTLPSFSINNGESLDIPEFINASMNISAEKEIKNKQLLAIQVDKIYPGRINGAEVVSLDAEISADLCQNSQIQGVVINDVQSWNGIRVKLNIDVNKWNSSRLTGILVKSAKGVENF